MVTRAEAPLATAHRALWVAAAFDFLAFRVGFDLDRRRHVTNPFEDSFPPRIFLRARAP